jgi:cytidylate kinase
VIQQAALNSSTVVVGRGAQFFLPPERGLRIWLIAPLPKRIERVGMLHGFNRAQSREYIERTDREYRDFVSRYFHHDVADPHLYDEVFNTEHLKLDEVADIIVDLCREHFIS